MSLELLMTCFHMQGMGIPRIRTILILVQHSLETYLFGGNSRDLGHLLTATSSCRPAFAAFLLLAFAGPVLLCSPSLLRLWLGLINRTKRLRSQSWVSHGYDKMPLPIPCSCLRRQLHLMLLLVCEIFLPLGFTHGGSGLSCGCLDAVGAESPGQCLTTALLSGNALRDRHFHSTLAEAGDVSTCKILFCRPSREGLHVDPGIKARFAQACVDNMTAPLLPLGKTNVDELIQAAGTEHGWVQVI